MDEIKDVKQALSLMKNYVLLSKPYGGSPLYYILKDDYIMVVNDNLKAYITIDDFISAFHESKFYILKDSFDQLVIKQEFIKLRQ